MSRLILPRNFTTRSDFEYFEEGLRHLRESASETQFLSKFWLEWCVGFILQKCLEKVRSQ